MPGFQLKPEPRAVAVVPGDLRIRPAEPDPLHPPRRLVRMSFALPRGSYATLVVHRLVGPQRSGEEGRHRPPRKPRSRHPRS